MKSTVKKFCSFLLVVCLAASLFAGCGSEKAEPVKQPESTQKQEAVSDANAGADTQTGIDTSKEVKLKMYLLGDQPADTGLVYDEVNKLLKNDINATVETIFLSWSNYQTKYPLVLASGEDYDLIYAALWCDYINNSKKGAFLELTDDLLNKYAPQTVKNTPKNILDDSRVDGKLYHLPQNFHEYFVLGLTVRGDLMKKYGMSEIKTVEDWEKYLDNVAKNEKGLIPFNAGTKMDYWALYEFFMAQQHNLITERDKFLKMTVTEKIDPELKTINLLEDSRYIDFLKKMREWYTKGFWSKNVLVSQTTSKDMFKEGKSACAAVNLGQGNELYRAAMTSHPEWDTRFYQLYPDSIQDVREFGNNGVAINKNSNNAERALMFLDLLRNDERYYRLTNYGIEGKHYTLTSDNKVKPAADSAGFPVAVACPWGWNSDALNLYAENDLPNYAEIKDNLTKNLKPLTLRGFNPSNDAYKKAMPIMNDLENQYIYPLEWGLVDNVDKYVATLKQKMEAAKIPEAVEETRKEAMEWLKNKK